MKVTKIQRMRIEGLSAKLFRVYTQYNWNLMHGGRPNAGDEVTADDIAMARGELRGYVAACTGLMPADICIIEKTAWMAIDDNGVALVTGNGSTVNWHI